MKKKRKITYKKQKIARKPKKEILINKDKVKLELIEQYFNPQSKIKKFLKIIFFIALEIIVILLIIFFSIYLYRTISPRQIDDVSPQIQCDKELLAKADVYYVIPKFKNISIADNPEWCKYVLSLNKTLAMHGVTHEYMEFSTNKDSSYVEEGMDIFEKCFGYKPKRFRAPQLEINEYNKKLIQKMGLMLDHYLSVNLHKSYHCNDTGLQKNKNIDLF